jgi:sigma-B regulation protein RsbQ
MAERSVLQRNNVHLIGNLRSDQVLVFGHGFGTDQSVWSDVAFPFLADYCVVLFDHVGSGKSDPEAYSAERYDTLDAYADDLIEVLETLHLKDVIMVAHSMCVLIAIKAMVRAPQFFGKLVLLGGSPRYLGDIGYEGAFEASDLENIFEAIERNYLAWASGFAPLAMQNDDRPDLSANFAASLMALRPDVALQTLQLAFRSDIRPLLSDIKIPTLILQLQDDVAVPVSVGRYLEAHIRQSHFHLIDAQGHFPHVSAPNLVIESIKAFLND